MTMSATQVAAVDWENSGQAACSRALGVRTTSGARIESIEADYTPDDKADTGRESVHHINSASNEIRVFGSNVARLRADEPAVSQLLQAMGSPPEDPAYGKSR